MIKSNGDAVVKKAVVILNYKMGPMFAEGEEMSVAKAFSRYLSPKDKEGELWNPVHAKVEGHDDLFRMAIPLYIAPEDVQACRELESETATRTREAFASVTERGVPVDGVSLRLRYVPLSSKVV